MLMVKKWLVMMSLSIFLLTGLSTSSFFLADFLTKIIGKNEQSKAQFNFALEQENEAALLFALKKSPQASKKWQELAKVLAKSQGEAAYQLASFYINKEYLSNEHIDPQVLIQIDQAILWYQQAIRLNYPKASIALADLYFHQNNLTAAQNILATLQVIEFSPYQNNDFVMAAIILSIKVAISTGNIELVNSLFIKFSPLLQVNEAGSALLRAIEKYQVLSSIDGTSINSDTSIHRDRRYDICPNSIQVFATNLINLVQAERLVNNFKKQPLNDLVCFSPVRYLPLSTLSCSTVRQNAILCDESKLHGIASTVTTRYIAIMLPEGGANVHFGMLYFDAQDSVDVVEHEISHLLGFVDEYPLVKGHVKCRTSQQQVSAENIAVLKNNYQGERGSIRAKVLKQLAWAKQIKKSTPILQFNDEGSKKNQYWQLGTPEQFEQEVGLFKAQTCDNNSSEQQKLFNAFKPLSARTKLQYDELNFPEQYIELLGNNSQQFLMPSFHYNIALAYYQQNNMAQANNWLEQAASWESDVSRRQKVRQGNY